MERLLATHAVSAHRLARLVLPSMRQRPSGDIVISRRCDGDMAANGGAYNMAKAALEALGLTLAKEERRHGIHVNVVAPGLVETEWASAWPGRSQATVDGGPPLARRRVAVRSACASRRRRRGGAVLLRPSGPAA